MLNKIIKDYLAETLRMATIEASKNTKSDLAYKIESNYLNFQESFRHTLLRLAQKKAND